jgi:DNA-binding IclR family transcriptional regulator
MSRRSPAVDRIVSILNFVVEHPDQSFTLTQIVTALRLSRATAHALLMGLVDTGFLYRAPDKSYMVGPALISLAVNAQRHVSPLAVARQEMRMLADEFDILAAAIFKEGDELVVRERAASLSHLGDVLRYGHRFPVVPPRNFFLLALSDAELEAELKRSTPKLSDDEMRNTRGVMDFAHQYGFVLGAEVDKPDPESSFVLDGRRYILKLDPKTEYRLQFLVAPVYDGQGQVAFGLTIWGVVRPLTGAEVLHMGKRLTEACARVGAIYSGSGHPPDLAPRTGAVRAAASKR